MKFPPFAKVYILTHSTPQGMGVLLDGAFDSVEAAKRHISPSESPGTYYIYEAEIGHCGTLNIVHQEAMRVV